MVDALSSGGSECMLVGVQVPPLARAVEGLEPLEYQRFEAFRFPGKPAFDNIFDNKSGRPSLSYSTMSASNAAERVRKLVL